MGMWDWLWGGGRRGGGAPKGQPSQQEPPGQSTGLAGWLAGVFGWKGPEQAEPKPQKNPRDYPDPPSSASDDLRSEKVAAGPRSTILPNFLPYIDDVTGETAVMREQCRRMLNNAHVSSSLIGKIIGVM